MHRRAFLNVRCRPGRAQREPGPMRTARAKFTSVFMDPGSPAARSAGTTAKESHSVHLTVAMSPIRLAQPALENFAGRIARGGAGGGERLRDLLTGAPLPGEADQSLRR